ncbi:MAG: hypothetical protein ACYDA3_01055 [Gaiellaceae bacterium]
MAEDNSEVIAMGALSRPRHRRRLDPCVLAGCRMLPYEKTL